MADVQEPDEEKSEPQQGTLEAPLNRAIEPPLRRIAFTRPQPSKPFTPAELAQQGF